jgi:hypothetical protein
LYVGRQEIMGQERVKHGSDPGTRNGNKILKDVANGITEGAAWRPVVYAYELPCRGAVE